MKTRATADRDKVGPVKINGLTAVEANRQQHSPVENITPTGRDSPFRRKTKINKTQDERMQLITKALKGWNSELKELFSINTWKELIKKVKKGAPDERRFNIEENVKRLAESIIEQIASMKYRKEVGQIISTRRGRGGEDRSIEFLLLCDEFESKQSDQTWKRAIGEDCEEEKETLEENGNSANPCISIEYEIEGEKENVSQPKRQTRNSVKAQTPLGVKPSQAVEKLNQNNSTPNSKTRPSSINSIQAISFSKGNFDCKTSLIDENLEIKTVSPIPSLAQDDEFIENDTPPPTPLNGTELSDHSIPRKRTRFNSRDLEKSSYNGKIRGRADVSCGGFGDTEESSRCSRVITENPTMSNGFDYESSLCSTSTSMNGKDFMDDLPELEPPEPGRDKENLPKSEQEILRDYPKPITGPELRPYMFEEIEEVLSRPKKDKIVSAFGLTLMQEQLAVYNKSEWLEDANIDFYLEMIRDRNNKAQSGYPRVYIFQSYFYKLLDKRGYESVQGATGKDNIFEYELVLVPIHSDHHWVLVVVNFEQKTMACYDSMDHNNDKHLRIIAGYLKQEWREKIKSHKDSMNSIRHVRNSTNSLINDAEEPWDWLGDDWNVQTLGADDIPQQKNGRDCGVFCLQFAEYLSRRQDFDFEQRHTAYFRKRMMYETLRKTLLIS